MKKLISCTLTALLLFSLAACSDEETNTATNTDVTSVTEESTAAEGMEVVVGLDENGNPITEIYTTKPVFSTTDPMSEVTVVIPYNYIYSLDAKYQNDLQLYCDANGFKSYTADEANGTVTFKMTAAAHNTFLSALRFEMSKIFSSLINTYPFFDQFIANNMEYTDVSIRVDKKAYQKDSNSGFIVDYVASLCMNSYQIFLTTTDYHCTIKIIDKDTGDIIETFEKSSVFSS